MNNDPKAGNTVKEIKQGVAPEKISDKIDAAAAKRQAENPILPPEKKVTAQTPAQPKNVVQGVVPDKASLSPQLYEVQVKSFINNQIVNKGDRVQLPDGVNPGKNLRPIGKDGRVMPSADDVAKARHRANPALTGIAGGQVNKPIPKVELDAEKKDTHVGDDNSDPI